MNASELSRIERSVLIQASRQRVWRALTDLTEFSKWFGVKAEGRFTPGARIEMTVTTEAYEGKVFYLTVEKVEPMDFFSWRWHPGAIQPQGQSEEPMTLVEFRLENEGTGTRVTVVESGFDALSLAVRAKAFKENTEGWEYELGNLQRYASQSA